MQKKTDNIVAQRITLPNTAPTIPATGAECAPLVGSDADPDGAAVLDPLSVIVLYGGSTREKEKSASRVGRGVDGGSGLVVVINVLREAAVDICEALVLGPLAGVFEVSSEARQCQSSWSSRWHMNSH